MKKLAIFLATLLLPFTVSATILPVAQGGTGWGNPGGFKSNAVLYGNGLNPIATTTAGSNGQFLSLVGGVPTWASVSSGSGTISTSSALAAPQIVYATGVNTVASAATTTLSGTGGISVSNAPFVIGASGAVISCASCTLNGVTSVGATWPIISSGGTTPTISFGWATTSQPGSSNIFVSNGTNGFYGVATSTLTASSPLTGSFTQIGTGGSVGCQTASGSQAGCLSSTDWTTFNNKVPTTRTLTAGAGLTGGGDLSADRTFAIDFTRINSWTGLQQFTNASSSLFSVTNKAYFGGSGTSTFSSTGNLTLVNAANALTIPALGTAAGTFLAADANGNVIATTTPTGSSTGFTQAVQWATSAVLAGTPTYSNGTGGVGATLTEIGTGALSVDGNSPAAGDRVLVKNQASALQNGIYTVTATGSGIASYILTRATDYDSPSEIVPGISTYVLSGTANADSFWSMTSGAPITVGTTALNYVEVSAGGAAVTSVSNADGTLTISPTAGSVVASIALGHANTWTGQQTFNTSAPIFGTLSGLLQGNGASAVTAVAGTAGQFPYYNGTNTLLATSTIFLTPASAVGIGTLTPSAKFDVQGTSTAATGQIADFWKSDGTNVMRIRNDGNVGIGTTTPWGKLSVASPSMVAADYANPLFIVATSSDATGQLFSVFATTSEVVAGSPSLFSNLISSVRVAIGAISQYGFTGTLDQLFVNGRINTGDWFELECAGYFGGLASITTDTAQVCDGFSFQIDTQGSFFMNNTNLSTSIAQTGATANSGSGIFAGSGISANAFTAATNTPIIEGSIRNVPASPLATTTAIFGFTNTSPSGTSFEVAPTAGCYYIASIAAANWQAVCKNGGAATTVDSGISTTTDAFIRFRIEMGASNASFYVQSNTTNLQNIAIISTNYPSSTFLWPGLYINRTTAAANFQYGVQFGYIRLWFRKNLWPS